MEEEQSAHRLSRRSFLGTAAAFGASAALLPRGGMHLGDAALRNARAARSSSPKRGGTLNVGVLTDVEQFNPDYLEDANFIYTRNIYDTLIGFTPSLQPIPRAAKSFAFNHDYTSILVHLRPNMYFQSGQRVNAHAVWKSFEFALNPNTGQQVKQLVAQVSDVKVRSQLEVEIVLSSPTPQLAALDVLEAVPLIDPVMIPNGSAAALQKKGSGSGPFRFVNWNPGTSLELERFTHYWDKPYPYLNKVMFNVYASAPESMVAALRSGAIDVAYQIPASLAKTLGNNFVIQQGYPGSLTYVFQINAAKAPFNNKKARQALQFASNREGMVKAALSGFSSPTALPWGPNSPAYDPKALKKVPFDLRKAKALLEAAGLAPGTSFDCKCGSAYPETITMAEILKGDLNQIGYDVNITVEDTAAWVADFVKGNFDIFPQYSGNLAKYPTACTLNSGYRFLSNTSWGGHAPPQAWMNAVNKANAALTKSAQHAAFNAMNAVLLDGSWMINLAYNESLTALSKHVNGYVQDVDDMVLLNGTWLS